MAASQTEATPRSTRRIPSGKSGCRQPAVPIVADHGGKNEGTIPLGAERKWGRPGTYHAQRGYASGARGDHTCRGGPDGCGTDEVWRQRRRNDLGEPFAGLWPVPSLDSAPLAARPTGSASSGRRPRRVQLVQAASAQRELDVAPQQHRRTPAPPFAPSVRLPHPANTDLPRLPSARLAPGPAPRWSNE